MANVSQFYSQEFLDSNSLNNAISGVIGAVQTLTQESLQPGLVSPDTISFGVTGLNVTVTMPAPFGVVFGSYVSSQAHGTVSGQDTQSYNVSFASVVPVSGSVTAYLLASYVQIQQNQFAIIGPPPGHPDFNPNFQPYNAYATAVDSVALTVGLSGADNSTTFEIARVTLSPGATGVSPLNTDYWQRASEKHHYPIRAISSVTVTPSQAGQILQLPSGNNIYSLPPLSQVNGKEFVIAGNAAQSVMIVQANANDPVGTNLIFGCFPNPRLGYPAFLYEPGNAVKLVAANGYWQVLSGTARSTMFRAMQTASTTYYINAQTGSNSNSGLSAGSAWQTLQYGHDFVHNNIDLGGYQAIFSCAGNFTAGVESCGPWIGQTEPYNVSFVFASGSTVSVTGASCFLVHTGSALQIAGAPVLNATGTGPGSNLEGGIGINCKSIGRILISGPVIFGACQSSHIRTGWGGIIHINSNYSITGAASAHYQADDASVILFSYAQGDSPSVVTFPVTVSLAGTPNFATAFAYSNGGLITASNATTTYSGSGTGPRYLVANNGLIQTFGAGGTFFPGSVGGSGTNYSSYQ